MCEGTQFQGGELEKRALLCIFYDVRSNTQLHELGDRQCDLRLGMPWDDGSLDRVVVVVLWKPDYAMGAYVRLGQQWPLASYVGTQSNRLSAVHTSDLHARLLKPPSSHTLCWRRCGLFHPSELRQAWIDGACRHKRRRCENWVGK